MKLPLVPLVLAAAGVLVSFSCAEKIPPPEEEEGEGGSGSTWGGGNTTSSGTSSSGATTSGGTSSSSSGGTSSSSSGSTTSSSSGSTSSSSSSSSSGGSPPAVAAPCTSNAQCGTGRCILPTDDEPALGGGAPGGYCTKDCETDADCPGASACITDANGVNGICLLTCAIGPELQYVNDPLDPGKCEGREDARCLELASGTTVCLPLCGSDWQCGARSCDPLLAVCVDAPSTGLPSGSTCDPQAATPECAGICVSFEGGTTSCSNACALGGEDIVNSPDCGGITSGMCAYAPAGYGAGDNAYCAPACLQHSDCQNPAFWCSAIGNLTGALIDNGFCFGADPCPNGQSDCTIATDVCTSTAYGPYCIDSVFPLGGAAP